MLTARVENGGSYERYYIVTGMNEETLYQAQGVFEDYCAKGVILSKAFSDDEWLLTNQITKMTLCFRLDELAFKRNTEKWLGCSYHCFVNGMKAYVVFHMGSINLSGIRDIVRKLMWLVDKPYNNLPTEMHLAEFLKLLPGSEAKDQIVEELEERIMFSRRQQVDKRQRVLAGFSAYFNFNEALEAFWSKANDCDKLFYFPLYFWWNLTAILPLRPTEFLLTPRRCIERQNGGNILTIRRTTLKKGQRKIRYSINGDYKLKKYVVPDKMFAALECYVQATTGMTLSSLDTLFVQQPHYSYLGRTAPPASVYYSYQNLSYCLRRFQDDIMKIDSDSSRINLGDTRHLAMISLIASGGSPTICKELAEHEDINISSRYYSNISKFVECATYSMYKKQKEASVDMLSYKPFCTGETVEVNGGHCDSAAYIAGDVSDCIRIIGTDGELGQCISCPHFVDNKSGKYFLFLNADERKNQVDEDSKYLMRMLEMVRKGRGCNENIQSALLKLQHSSSQYSQCLYKNMEGLR